MEKRHLPATEVRASKSGSQMKVSGYAATYGTLSRDLPAGNGTKFRERIAKRAFDTVLADPNLDCVCTFNHNQDAILGRTTSGTLRLKGDNRGLAFECDLPNTQVGRDVYESVKRGDLNGCSFAFELGERDQEWDEEEIEDEKDLGILGRIKNAFKTIVRTIKSFRKLHDVSIVTTPAYPGTQLDARNLVAAEVRSYVESRWATKTQVWQRGAIGVYFESDADDLLNQRARQRMLQEILD
jgi:HK97 family phage prohead protease